MIGVIEQFIPTGTKRRSGIKNAGVSFIVSHDTGNDGSTAKQNVSYYINSANEMEASAHFFVDDKQIICCIPENEKAWHVRYNITLDNEIYQKDANDWAIGVELCFHSKNTLVDNIKAYNNYVDLHVYLCQKYKINPSTGIVGHYKLDPTRRTDPLNAFKYLGKTWPDFIADIMRKILPEPETSSHNIKAQIKDKLAELNILVEKIT